MTLGISSKGWVFIPAELRRKYRLWPGTAVQIVDYGGVLAIVPALDDPLRQTAGLLAARSPEKKPLTRACWKNAGENKSLNTNYPFHRKRYPAKVWWIRVFRHEKRPM